MSRRNVARPLFGPAWLLAACVLPPPTPAPWVSLHPPDSSGDPTKTGSPGVPLSVHTYVPESSVYNPDVVGNLKGVPHSGPLLAARDRALVAQIGVGTPGQKLACLLDTNTADLWLPSFRCSSCAADLMESFGFFHAAESSTFQPLRDESEFGSTPRSIRIVYGGGSVVGYLVNDTVSIGSVTLTSQTFLLAEAGGAAARNSRAWDGVCGLGRKSVMEMGAPVYQRLPEVGLKQLFSIVPDKDSSHSARLVLGEVPQGLADPGSITWIPARADGDAWELSISISSSDPERSFGAQAAAVIETGTSYMLVPAHSYLRFARSLFPKGVFDDMCGVDKKAGGIVICDCGVRSEAVADVIIEVVDEQHQRKKMRIEGGSLFRESAATGGGLACVFQVQQRPSGARHTEAFGVLGPPLMEGLNDPHTPTDPEGFPAAPPSLFPSSLPLAPGPKFNPFGLERDPEEMMDNLTQALGLPFPDLPHGAHGGVTEVAMETLDDGTVCRTEIVRASNGTILKKMTKATSPEGTPLDVHGPQCAGTEAAARTNLMPPFLAPPGFLRPGVQARSLSPSRDLWVLGEVFFRGRAMVFDFEGARVGFGVAEESRAGRGSTNDHKMARVEALAGVPQEEQDKYELAQARGVLAQIMSGTPPHTGVVATFAALGFTSGLLLLLLLLNRVFSLGSRLRRS